MADVKQYINIDPTKPDQLNGLAAKQAGRIVKLEATVKPEKENVWVTFAVTAGNKNIKGDGKTRKRRVRTNAKGIATYNLELSQYGGDEYEVSAYVNEKDGKLISDKYTVWRRIYYQMSRFDGVPGTALAPVPKLDLGPVKAELEGQRHCIELVNDSTTDRMPRYANVLTSENKSRDYKRSGKHGYDERREPVAMRIVVVHRIAESKTAVVTFSGVGRSTVLGRKLPHDLWVDESFTSNDDWLIKAQWKWKWGSVTWHDLDRSLVSKLDNKIVIDMGQIAIPARQSAMFGEELQVRVKYRYVSASMNGICWYNAIWLASSSMGSGDRSDDAKKQTAIHEIGHWLGMVPPGQKTRYTGRGHQGPHCSTGLSATDRLKLSYRGLRGTCVMFGESAESRNPDFCDRCSPSVRKSKVQRDGMPGSWT